MLYAYQTDRRTLDLLASLKQTYQPIILIRISSQNDQIKSRAATASISGPAGRCITMKANGVDGGVTSWRFEARGSAL
jgi:hypothetical protein